MRRAHMILMSADENLTVNEIGRRLGCSGQAVREALHACDAEGWRVCRPNGQVAEMINAPLMLKRVSSCGN